MDRISKKFEKRGKKEIHARFKKTEKIHNQEAILKERRFYLSDLVKYEKKDIKLWSKIEEKIEMDRLELYRLMMEDPD